MHEAFWQGRRVLVTGHTGFKGAWLCLFLRRLGARVFGYALAPPTNPSLYTLAEVDTLVVSTIGDMRDIGRFSRALAEAAPDVLIHMAAQSVVLTSYEDPADSYSTNVIGTVNVLEAVRRSRSRVAVVNVTTDKVYQNNAWDWGYRETDALGGRDPYSNSKACSELVTQAFRHSYFAPQRYAEHGVAIAAARAGNVIGGGDWTAHQLVPAIIAAYAKQQPVDLRSPASVRPWQHVLDCLAGYVALAQALATEPLRCSGEWNFGPAVDDVYTVAQVAEALAAHWQVAPAWTSAVGTHAHEEFELQLDSSKARRQLNWRPRLSTGQALDWVAQWYLKTQSGSSARAACDEQIESYLARHGAGSI